MKISLRVMTYNIRYDAAEDPENWKDRKYKVQSIIQQENPDLIGMQECLHHQMSDLEALLPEYKWIGLGREGGSKGEYTPIFYKKDRFRVLEYDHFWLSDTPYTIASRTWGNEITRIATWVRLFDERSGEQFYHMNTHLDHVSQTARTESAALIHQQLSDLKSSLFLLTGDFNLGYSSEVHTYLTKEAELVDVWDAAAKKENEQYGSFNDFRDPTGGEDRIDWILLKGNAEVAETKLVMDKVNDQFPSDHFPVVTEIQIKK